MARDILSIPLTSVSVERIFSSAKDVIPYRRNRLSANMVEQLLIAKSEHKNQLHGEINQPHREINQPHGEIPADRKDSDTDNISSMNVLDSEFLQQMVPQDYLGSDDAEESASDTELDTDVDFDKLHTSFVHESVQSAIPTPNP